MPYPILPGRIIYQAKKINDIAQKQKDDSSTSSGMAMANPPTRERKVLSGVPAQMEGLKKTLGG